ncbi:MAG: bifunctional hydroxymethylpyrimidine kinase/phosphomethylpyrimidine kinase [Methyloversatilis discipulorum]|uniref:bifunctional hydroxymethylpyrimidine kinase/phosphomethylpyrimidine kinase n=1 Tax=Methyloversatilis discipulorum TaxID=1119528 RepID=UPI0026EE21BA|nr:bifunctional hydroxymethylpyrimidine kinase/phosphomethylpyrimidine kinase [Methyloversatilis discipulorum]MBT9518503.1 bifunctional hydroxymethylpyrimidine kinase/phosphomethylpyrimidine kinase [Methyloversatilis discipulorum]
MIPNVLTIAGTDPTGGAGIQADLKTFSALGAYGMSAITAVVAQNTCGVRSFVALEPDFVGEQIDAVFDDVRVDAVKVGMIANAAIACVVADRLRRYARCPVVVDPVMVAKSGDHLLLPDAVAALRDELLPLATLITPNLPEAAVLLDRPAPQTLDDMRDMLTALRAHGPQWVLLKGGHLRAPHSTDLLAGPDVELALPAQRIVTTHDHGTGCTLAAAAAALLPTTDVVSAVRQAKDYLGAALAAAYQLEVGRGRGPVHHFHALWK